ncbi:OLC1v1031857C1 [Oldenlandia corymbosa var. corymbosa]|uniref:OLC1v1031857C1 n=1 Tax=Oldenlandia corymbosa var. corymbosa TaxID=529605 RepID=A0AAV1CJI2_OLDCO|nr:OLC1v1031857C1 [Oldenlandia corymbosa var. corymbosa]
MDYMLEDFAHAIERVESSIPRLNDYWSLDGVTLERLESVTVELNFLYLFVGYSYKWSDASSSALCHSETEMNSLYIKFEELISHLRHAFIDRFTHPYHKFNTNLSELLAFYTSFNQNIDHLKSAIQTAYQGGSSVSTQSIHPCPPSTTTYDWKFFCDSLRWNIKYLSNYGVYSLRTQMKALHGSLCSLDNLSVFVSLHDDWSPWMDKMMDYIRGTIVQVAHLCCFCWYSAPLILEIKPHVENSLSDLLSKSDTGSSEFVGIALGFLRPYDEEQSEKSVCHFLYDMLGLEDQEGFLFQAIKFILFNFIQLTEDMDDFSGISLSDRTKFVVLLTISLKGQSRRHKTYFALLLAHIWSMIAIEIQSSKLDEHVKAFHEGYRLLEDMFSSMDEKSKEYQTWKVIERVPKKVQSLYQYYRSEEAQLVYHMFANLYLHFTAQMSIINLMEVISELMQEDSSLMQKYGTFFRELFFLKDAVIIMTVEEIMEGDSQLFKDFVNVFLDLIIRKRGVNYMNVPHLLQKVLQLKEKFNLQLPTITLPKTPGLCFIEFLVPNLRELLSRNHDLVPSAVQLIEAICSDLEFIISAFGYVLKHEFEQQDSKDLHTQLTNAGYLAEYMIDLMALGDDTKTQHLMGLHHAAAEIRNIKWQLNDSYKGHTCGGGAPIIPQKVMLHTSQVTTTTVEIPMIGFTDEKKDIIDLLTGDKQKRDIVSIVGMPGIGKTTLAHNVFCNATVIYHFSIRAWCCVSQTYRRRDLLLDILSHIIPITEDTHKSSDNDLKDLLRRQLKGKKYLIVMDDMWKIEAWDDLQISFPDDSQGSRILITSRAMDEVSKISTKTQILLPLSEEESWQLLKSKIFPKEECPEELLTVGQEIARNCKGLPLAIVAIAGILNRCGKNPDLWKQNAKRVRSLVLNDPGMNCKEILELSFNQLPDHLRACFLYFGAFQEDKDISVWRLQLLWIAEGFVPKMESKSVEHLAEDCLMDLIGRSLVIVSKRKSNGKVKACRVHDMVRDLCRLKAKDENFWQFVSGTDEPYSEFDASNSDIPLEFLNISNKTYKEYRLCFSMKRKHFVASKPSGPFVRSLLFFATADMHPRCPYDVSFIPSNYKRLRVLDLESINMGYSLPNGIELILDLRYLAISGDVDSITPSLSDLKNLETLLVKSSTDMVLLPETIWRMTKLRHIHVTNFATFIFHHEEHGSTSELYNLVSLSLPCFTCRKETSDMMMRFPNLQKLRCLVLEPRDFSEGTFQFPAFGSLCQLDSLKVSYYGKVLNVGELNFPSSIKKLTLSNFRLPWSHISVIGRLHNLEVLKLISRAFEGSRWDMEEEEFSKLKYLKLDTLNFECWNAYSDNFPQLQQLVVRHCMELEEIPIDFASISTLQAIEVQQCGISVEESVGRIKEQDIEGLMIVINSSHSTS